MPRSARAVLWLAVLVIGLAVILKSCSSDDADAGYEDTVVLISIDGFRADYLDWYDAPTLEALASEGVHANEGMLPVFPSLTFPNHYSIVTGLYPEHHGIVSNTMHDREMDERFTIRDREAIEDSRWWGGEPIWVTASKHDVMSATYFWVGSEAPVQGVQPTYWFPYDGSIPGEERIDQALAWLDLPNGERPGFVSVYFSEVDSEGHRYGIGSTEVEEAVERVDGYIARFMAGLEERGIHDDVNVIIVSDHGMADIADDRVIFLDNYIDLSDVDPVDVYTVVGLNPVPGAHDRVLNALKGAHPNFHVFEKGNVPERYHYNDHPRIPDIVGIADPGWMVRRERVEFDRARFGGATHGYDNRAEEMKSLFIATGPAFVDQATIAPFENIHLYELMTHIMGIAPAENDGDLTVFEPILAGAPDS